MPADDKAQTGPDARENMECIGNIRNGALYINCEISTPGLRCVIHGGATAVGIQQLQHTCAITTVRVMWVCDTHAAKAGRSPQFVGRRKGGNKGTCSNHSPLSSRGNGTPSSSSSGSRSVCSASISYSVTAAKLSHLQFSSN